MTSIPDPFDELRKIMTDDNCRQFVDNIYETFQRGGGEGKTTIWWKNRKPRYFEISVREDAK